MSNDKKDKVALFADAIIGCLFYDGGLWCIDTLAELVCELKATHDIDGTGEVLNAQEATRLKVMLLTLCESEIETLVSSFTEPYD